MLSHAWQLLNIRSQDGKVLTEYSPPSGGWRFIFIYAGNQRIAMRRANGTLHYYLNDHLGSARVVLDSTGTVWDNTILTPNSGISAKLLGCV